MAVGRRIEESKIARRVIEGETKIEARDRWVGIDEDQGTWTEQAWWLGGHETAESRPRSARPSTGYHVARTELILTW